MPLYKRLPFQRRLLERRSLRVPSQSLKSHLGLGSRMSAVISENSVSEEIEDGESSSTYHKNTREEDSVKKTSSASKNQSSVGPVTPIDLELDLAAQQSKLKMLQDEIDRLKAIKVKLEEAKVKGDKDVPNWFLEEERFQQMLSKVQYFEMVILEINEIPTLFFFSVSKWAKQYEEIKRREASWKDD